MKLTLNIQGMLIGNNWKQKNYLSMDNTKIPNDYDFSKVKGLSNEARQKFTEIKPLTLGQASRIPGVPVSAISLLAVNLKK